MGFFGTVSSNTGGGSSPQQLDSYLNQKVDNLTIAVENGQIIVKNIDGLEITPDELNEWLGGTTDNIQYQFNTLRDRILALSKGMKWRGEVATYSILLASTDNDDGDTYVVTVDETRGNIRVIYVYNAGNWVYIGQFDYVPDATLENKGIVQLSNDYRSTSAETVPTSEVLSTVYDQTTEAFSGLAQYVLERTRDANTERKGIVQLAESYSSDSTETVPTSKILYDLYTMFLRNFNSLSEYIQTKTADATVESKGVVQLEDGYESESTETVPTSRAVNEMFRALVATVMGLAEYLNEHVDENIASTDTHGHVMLTDSYTSDSIDTAPTAKALNDLYKANSQSAQLFVYALDHHIDNFKATLTDVGHVKPDGTTLTVDGNGVMSVASSQDQGLVAVHAQDEPDYLGNKLDNVTIAIEGTELKVKSVDGLAIGTTQLNAWLSGTEGNLQGQINDLNSLLSNVTSGMRYLGKFEEKSFLERVTNKNNGDLAVVLVDETKSNARTMYVYSESLDVWEFLGAFEFSDEFLALKDTPNSYVGQNGKILKVDETNKKVVFSDIDYSEIENKPTSTITQIDNAVGKAHEHSNKSSLDKLGVNENGELTVNGVVYAPKIDIPQKQYLYARRGSSDQVMETGDTCIFNTSLRGSIPYNSSTGTFTLTANKTYRVTVSASFNTEGYVILRLADTNNTQPHTNSAIWTDVTRSWREASAGNLEVIVTPLSTKDFKIYASAVSGTSSMRTVHSALIVQEL